MSREMGKNLHHQESQLTLKHHNPGCMWGIFHHLQHNRWHRVMKSLPRKRLTLGKHSTDQGRTRSTPDAAEVQDKVDVLVENSGVETKSIEPSPAHKSSMKSRIRALITEDLSWRRGRHRRSSSYPTRKPMDRTIPVHNQGKSLDIDSPAENKSNDNLCVSDDNLHSNASLDDPLLPKIDEENGSNNISSCELCATMLKVNYLKQSEVNKLGKQPVRDHTLLHGNLIYAIEPSKCDSLQESKLFMDALDLLDMRQEVFLKILQDPSSSLAQQLHYRRMPNLRFGLTKSVSFPASTSSDKGDLKSESSTTKQENRCCVREEDELQHVTEETGNFNKCSATRKGLYTEDGSPEQVSREIELSDNASSAAANMLRKRHDNKVVLKSFKNIREKIKHVIRDKKKEKNRIIKDALHHKIPYGHSVSKNDGQVGSDFGKSPVQVFKRTSSFNDSFDKYNQLLEISLNREAKDHISDRLRFKPSDTQPHVRKSPATLGRILSLPDLRSYSSIQIDDSASNSSLQTSDTVAVGNMSVGSVVVNELKPLDLGSKNKAQTCSISESGSQENLLDVGETIDESADSKTSECASPRDLNLDPVSSSTPRPSKSDQVSEDDSKSQEQEFVQEIEVSVSEDSKFVERILFPAKEDSSAIQQDLSHYDSSIVSEETIDIDTKEIEMQQFYSDLFHVQVDAKNKAEFNYVKDVLELSGFSKNEILGKWHSEEHPVNPLVFEEVEGCSVDQPESEEDGNNDRLLLFDIINEVLLGIHERSFCYWPTPLTSQSHIHQLPKGYYVLEEVWADIRWLLSWKPDIDQPIDVAVSRDLAKHGGWMNLQLDAECVGLELEDLIFDDLLEEIISARLPPGPNFT